MQKTSFSQSLSNSKQLALPSTYFYTEAVRQTKNEQGENLFTYTYVVCRYMEFDFTSSLFQRAYRGIKKDICNAALCSYTLSSATTTTTTLHSAQYAFNNIDDDADLLTSKVATTTSQIL